MGTALGQAGRRRTASDCNPKPRTASACLETLWLQPVYLFYTWRKPSNGSRQPAVEKQSKRRRRVHQIQQPTHGFFLSWHMGYSIETGKGSPSPTNGTNQKVIEAMGKSHPPSQLQLPSVRLPLVPSCPSHVVTPLLVTSFTSQGVLGPE